MPEQNPQEREFHAYQHPKLARVAQAEITFDQKTLPLLQNIYQEALIAFEEARASFLKTKEAELEFETLEKMKSDAEKEVHLAQKYIDEAQKLLESDKKAAIPATEEPPSIHAAITTHDAVLTRYTRMHSLIHSAQQIHQYAKARMQNVHNLTQMYAETVAESEKMNNELHAGIDLAERDANTAEKKLSDIEALHGKADYSALMELGAFAERASIKAKGAGLALQRAVTAAIQAEQVKSALVQAEREEGLLSQRVDQLMSCAHEMHAGIVKMLEEYSFEENIDQHDASEQGDFRSEKVMTDKVEEETESIEKRKQMLDAVKMYEIHYQLIHSNPFQYIPIHSLLFLSTAIAGMLEEVQF